jgi:uncharacterized membrane protein YphA (DoxX/SURF4 family)
MSKSKAGYILGILPCLLLLASGTMKLANATGLAEGFQHLGLPMSLRVGLGILELTCTAIYLIPRTAVLGAILLTGYMGGAILSHVRVGDPFFTQVLIGVCLWGGLYLRDERIRALIPFTSPRA